ncbi:MAG: hypothetical protein H7Z18_12390 [Methylophilaceae bacterium]|nr:hypothetical protein [Methylophilaceae bacterium]
MVNSLHLETILLDEQNEVSFQELADLSGFSNDELQLLVQSGALIPVSSREDSWFFSSHYVISIRTLSRLKQDFELEPNSLGLMLVFLNRIRTLEYQLNKQNNF